MLPWLFVLFVALHLCLCIWKNWYFFSLSRLILVRDTFPFSPSRSLKESVHRLPAGSLGLVGRVSEYVCQCLESTGADLEPESVDAVWEPGFTEWPNTWVHSHKHGAWVLEWGLDPNSVVVDLASVSIEVNLVTKSMADRLNSGFIRANYTGPSWSLGLGKPSWC
jgi:hypothetical protein